VNPDFLDMLSAFLDEDVEFLLVGAYALSAHGYPRATGDLDLWVNHQPDNAARIWKALTTFRAPLGRIKQEDFCNDDLIFQIGVVPNRIDIITQIDGVTFEEAWDDRIVIDMLEMKIPVISKPDLIRNKKATGRPKDKLDVLMLESDE